MILKLTLKCEILGNIRVESEYELLTAQLY